MSCDSAVWLIYCLNCYQFPGTTAILCYHLFTFSWSLTLEPAFWDSGEAWSKALHFKRWGTWGGGEGETHVSERIAKGPARFHSYSGGPVFSKTLHKVWSYGQNNYPPPSHVHYAKSFSESLHHQTLSWHCHEQLTPLQLSRIQSLLDLHRCNPVFLHVHSSRGEQLSRSSSIQWRSERDSLTVNSLWMKIWGQEV